MNQSHVSLAGLGLAGTSTGTVTGPVPRQARRGRRLAPVALLVEIALTVGSLLGVAVAGLTVTATRAGLRPLVVRSGSMEPTIPTGAMVLVKKIPAAEIRVGDILAVERSDRTRVTHRVLTVEHRRDVAELTMKGDANEDPDPLPVTVHHAHRLAWQLPMVGKTVAWLATAQGGFAMGCVATAFLRRATGRRDDRRATAGRRRHPARHG